MNRPRAGSVANAWTETSTPERTRKAPSRLSENPEIARSSVHARNAPRCSVTASEWIRAVATSHGMNEAFSTGSQNHHPPQPSSLYAHQLPSMMPPVRNAQATVVHGRVQRVHARSIRPSIRAATAKANGTTSPT